jgi:large subunit ribosomal protein L5
MSYDIKEKYKKEAIPGMKKEFGYKNEHAIPRISKVVVSTGTGSVKDKEKMKLIEEHLSIITGQRPVKTTAKKAIASFKTRKGSHVGYLVTLRGQRMYDFLNRMVFVAIPRQRDFRGINLKSIDSFGNLTMGFKDHLVFPEMVGQDVRDAFGFAVTVVTTAKSKDEAIEFFRLLGFPMKKK